MTQKRNLGAWKRELLLVFGAIRVADIIPADVLRWRDSLAGDQLEACSTELLGLAVMLDLIGIGVENMDPNTDTVVAIDGAADFLRYIRQSLDGIAKA